MLVIQAIPGLKQLACAFMISPEATNSFDLAGI
jgi:hypothetical protein